MSSSIKQALSNIARILAEFHAGTPSDQAKTPQLLKDLQEQLASDDAVDADQEARIARLEVTAREHEGRLADIETGLGDIDKALTSENGDEATAPSDTSAAPSDQTAPPVSDVTPPADVQPDNNVVGGETSSVDNSELPPSDTPAPLDEREGQTPTIDQTQAPLPDATNPVVPPQVDADPSAPQAPAGDTPASTPESSGEAPQ